MELRLASLFNGSIGVDLITMPRGAHNLEIIEPGDSVAYLILRGEVSAVYQGDTKLPRRKITARRGLPLVLVNVGTYAVYAESGVVGLRSARGGPNGR